MKAGFDVSLVKYINTGTAAITTSWSQIFEVVAGDPLACPAVGSTCSITLISGVDHTACISSGPAAG